MIFIMFRIIVVLSCAKSLQSCLTLCDPVDCSPPGSSAHGILQAHTTNFTKLENIKYTPLQVFPTS